MKIVVETMYSCRQINHALSLDGYNGEWVDPGIQNETCIGRPETCGPAGAAVLFWIKVTRRCSGACGVLSSNYINSPLRTHFTVAHRGRTLL